MPIQVVSEFRFNQFLAQDDGGWCAGISIALITHLYENLGEGLHYVTPSRAYEQAAQYIDILRASYNKITGRAQPGMQGFRAGIRDIQRPFDFGGGPTLAGDYEYDFTTPGTAFLRLYVYDPAHVGGFGADFQAWYSMGGGSNHAGMAVWNPAGTVFLFDPNCGGLLFRWAGYGSMPAALDAALADMYTRHDRLRGARAARVLSAQRLDPTTLPYGRV